MADSRDDIFEYLKTYKDRKEETDIELIKIESRLEDRIKEVKTDLKSDILQVKTDLENDIKGVESHIKEVKTDLKNDIQIVRDDIKERISGLRWFIGITVAIAAIVVPLIIKYL